jgi:hypothetical protein
VLRVPAGARLAAAASHLQALSHPSKLSVPDAAPYTSQHGFICRCSRLACRCTSGCSCEPKPRVDALHALRQSTIFLVRLLVSQAERCEISVTLLNDSSSGQHKFKVGDGVKWRCLLGGELQLVVVRCVTGWMESGITLLQDSSSRQQGG